MSKTFLNSIVAEEVSIGLSRLLIGPENGLGSWLSSPTRIDIGEYGASIPYNYYDLGAVVEDSPVFTYTRTDYSLEVGVPKVTQYKAVVGMDATFECSLHSKAAEKLQFALANIDNYSLPGEGWYFSVTDSSNGVGDDYIILDVSGESGDDWDVLDDAVDWIILTHANGSQVILQGALGDFGIETTISTDPAELQLRCYVPSQYLAGDFVSGVYHSVGYSSPTPITVQYYGTSLVKKYSLLGVTDFIDGSQIVHYMPRVQSVGDILEEYRPEQNPRLPLQFRCLGATTVVNSCTQSYVARRFVFPAAACTS